MERRSGFTLIELLIVIAIIAILSVVVILTLNPAELLRQSRDSTRISDFATMKNAISLYLTDVSNPNIAASPFGYSYAYFSQLNPPNLNLASSGIVSVGSASTTGSISRAIDSNGWLPINFTAISSGSPIGNEPVDPVNSTTTPSLVDGGPLIYGYVAKQNGFTFKLTAHMESAKYGVGGLGDVESNANDGGISTTTFEQGNNLAL